MTRSPLARACMALRLPRGLYCHQGSIPMSGDGIRASLRRTRVAGLTFAIADTIRLLEQIPDDAEDASAVLAAAQDACARNALSPSMVGVVLALALTGRSDDGEVTADEWALVVEAAS